MPRRLPLSTRAIQGARLLNYYPDDRWVDWAVRLMIEGADTPSLRIVAGLLPPFNYFEVTRLIDRALDELEVPALASDEAVGAYATDLVSELLRGPESMLEVLEELSQLCITNNYGSMLMPFYLLNLACFDLAAQNYQHYWAGANRSNVEQIVREQAMGWLKAQAVKIDR